MRVVLDTNVLVAAFVAHGACNELLEHCVLSHEVILAPFIIREFKEKLVEKFGLTAAEASRAVRLLKSRCIIINPKKLPESVCRDPDDDNIIATAVSGSCACIVTGDNDLLVLNAVSGIPIIPPSQFWEFEDTEDT